MREYRIKDDILNDVVAGLTVGVMHIPQGSSTILLTGFVIFCLLVSLAGNVLSLQEWRTACSPIFRQFMACMYLSSQL